MVRKRTWITVEGWEVSTPQEIKVGDLLPKLLEANNEHVVVITHAKFDDSTTTVEIGYWQEESDQEYEERKQRHELMRKGSNLVAITTAEYDRLRAIEEKYNKL